LNGHWQLKVVGLEEFCVGDVLQKVIMLGIKSILQSLRSHDFQNTYKAYALGYKLSTLLPEEDE
jgi:hypothetical protein